MISRIQSRMHRNSWSVMDVLRRGRARRLRARDRRQERIGIENLEERMLLSATKDPSSLYVDGEVLVGVTSAEVPADFNALLNSLNLPSSVVSTVDVAPILSLQQDADVLSVARLPLTDGTSVPDAVNALTGIEGIAFAEASGQHADLDVGKIMGTDPEHVGAVRGEGHAGDRTGEHPRAVERPQPTVVRSRRSIAETLNRDQR